MKPSNEDIERRMTYRPPTDATRPLHQKVNDTITAAAQILNGICPAGRNHSLMLTALEDARMRANAAIAQD